MNETPKSPPPAGQAARAPRQGFLGELRDAVAPGRTFILVIAVLLIQLGFVFSYVGAFHHPTPHGVPIAVVAPAQISGQLVGELNAIHGHPLHATAVADEAAGRTLLRHGSTSGVLIVNPTGKTDALLVAGGGGAATATAVEDVIAQAEATEHRNATVTDAVPAQPGDARGLTDFYLVVGWLIGGYLVAASASPHGHDPPPLAGRSSASSCSSPTPSSPDSAAPSSSAPSSARSPATYSRWPRSERSSSTAPRPSPWPSKSSSARSASGSH
jgi:hypothetical protein